MAHTGKKRRKDDEEFVIDDDPDSGSTAAGERPTKESNRVEDGVIVCELSKNRKVKVKKFKSMIIIDIREYYLKKDGDYTPSKKGISLTQDQWNMLRDHANDIDGAIVALKQ